MKKSKKILALILVSVLILTIFAGCSKGSSDKKISIGVCQLVQHDALDAATNGFIDAVKEKLGEDKVEIDVQNAQGDSPTCSTITNQFVANGVDLIFANATPALESAVSSTGTIPIVATSVTDYATALHISDWNGKTGMNVTGTADLAPLDKQAEIVKELVPDAKTVGIIYCSAEANSKFQADKITEEFKKMNLEVKEYTAADSNDIASVTTNACSEVDVLYIPTDNTMASNSEVINNIAEPAKIPVITGEENICKGCGIATLSVDYYSIGYQAGEMAVQIITENADPAEMEIKYATDLKKKYVADRCEKLGITIPEGYEAIAE